VSRFSIVVLVSTSCLAHPAFASEAGETATATESADPIVVIGQRDGYDAAATRTATKTDTPLKDVPQSVSVITEAQIDDQALRSIGDVLRYVPGALAAQGEGHRDQIVLRGNSSTADFFIDGLRDDVQYYRGLYNLDRVEVLQGPNALIFGRGGGGGIVNRVTKRPVAGDFVHGSISADNEGAWFLEGDVNGSLARAVTGRVNGVYEEFDTFRDEYRGRRFAINPTLAVQAGPDTRIDLGFEYARDRRVIDRGVPSDIRGRGAATIADPARPLDGFDSTFFGDEDVNRSRFTAKVGKIAVEHRFSDSLRLTTKALYGDYDKLYQNAFAAGPATLVAGVERVAIEAYRDPTSRENLLIQNDLVADFSTGPVRHTLLMGVDFADQRTRNQRINGFFDSGVPTTSSGRRTEVLLGDEISIPAITFRAGAGNRSVWSKADVVGVYVQDQAKIGDHVEIIAGLRRDWFDLEVDNLLSGQSFSRRDKLWSPRLGLVIKPSSEVSLYASISRSFLPQSGDQFNALDVSLEALKPERFTNLEVGAKWQPLAALSVTLAAYRLDRTNTRETDPLTLQTVLTGEQRSKGIELEVRGQVTPRLSLSGGLTVQDVEIRKSAVASLVGREAPLVPERQASLWSRYDFTPRIAMGLGVYHQSRTFASISNAVVLPAYTRVDAAGYFTLNERLAVQLNVENLLGEDYYSTAHNDNNITPGAPRTLRATVRFGL
jgi:catecholate siderophore receptor